MSDFQLSIGYTRAVLALSAEHAAAIEARIAKVEAEGYRVVDGGQTSEYEYSSGHGECDYEISDHRTGTVLVSGHGTIEDYRATSDRLQQDLGREFWHIDPLTDEVSDEGGYLDGPEHAIKDTYLGALLLTWTWDNEDDVRSWIDAGADEQMIHQALRYATDKIKQRDYLKSEGFTIVNVTGPWSFPEEPGEVWDVNAHDDSTLINGASSFLNVRGDRAELERVLREKSLIDNAAVEGSPLPDGLAGTLGQSLAEDSDAYCDLVSEYTGLVDPEIA